jgi:WD40 repeat protein
MHEKQYLHNHHIVKQIIEEDDSIMKETNINQPVLTINDGEYIIKGGYWDGKFLVYNLKKNESYYYVTDEDSKVVCFAVDKEYKFLMAGTTSGRLYVFLINTNGNLLELKKIITDHDLQINYIYYCNRLNIIATVSNDKTCNLYTFPTLKLFRVIKNENVIFDYCFISASYLPSIILYSKYNFLFVSYSINGKLLYSGQDGVKYLFSPRVITDGSHQDYLVYNLLI